MGARGDNHGRPAPGITGVPGTTEVGEFQDRQYGPTGKPVVDIDWGHSHHHPDLTHPHAHDWGPDGKRGRSRSATPEEIGWTKGLRDDDGKLNEDTGLDNDSDNNESDTDKD